MPSPAARPGPAFMGRKKTGAAPRGKRSGSFRSSPPARTFSPSRPELGMSRGSPPADRASAGAGPCPSCANGPKGGEFCCLCCFKRSVAETAILRRVSSACGASTPAAGSIFKFPMGKFFTNPTAVCHPSTESQKVNLSLTLPDAPVVTIERRDAPVNCKSLIYLLSFRRLITHQSNLN
jgi:hypothetical protein